MSEKFIKLNRENKYIEGLIFSNKNAFILLTIIALRARRTNEEHFDNLKIGECLLGDYKNYGMSRQEYRTSKLFLEKYQIVTFKTTNKGTIGKLISDIVYDINPTDKVTNKTTNKQPTSNQQATTNKNDKNDKNDKKEISKPKVLQNINPLIELFKTVNLTYENIFKNKTERGVLERFVKKYGYEKTENLIKWAIDNPDQYYCITKPTELERNINKLIIKNKGKTNNYIKI